jgi:hypothetical protein
MTNLCNIFFFLLFITIFGILTLNKKNTNKNSLIRLTYVLAYLMFIFAIFTLVVLYIRILPSSIIPSHLSGVYNFTNILSPVFIVFLTAINTVFLYLNLKNSNDLIDKAESDKNLSYYNSILDFHIQALQDVRDKMSISMTRDRHYFGQDAVRRIDNTFLFKDNKNLEEFIRPKHKENLIPSDSFEDNFYLYFSVPFSNYIRIFASFFSQAKEIKDLFSTDNQVTKAEKFVLNNILKFFLTLNESEFFFVTKYIEEKYEIKFDHNSFDLTSSESSNFKLLYYKL